MTLKTRKSALLISIAVLAVIYILQILTSNRSQEKIFKLEDGIDRITVADFEGTKLDVSLKDGKWFTSNFLASTSAVESIIDELKELKSLSTVSKSSNEANSERFGFSGQETFTLTAEKGGKTVRKVIVGKASSTNENFYFKVDSSSDIYLSSENLSSLFNLTDDEIRENDIFDLETGKIDSISLKNKLGSFEISRNTDSKDVVWMLNSEIPSNKSLSQELVRNFVNAVKIITVEKWNNGKDEYNNLSEESSAELSIVSEGKAFTVNVKFGGKDVNNQAVASNFEDCFELPLRTVNVLENTVSDGFLTEKAALAAPEGTTL